MIDLDRRTLTAAELARVTYRAGLLFEHLPQVQTACSLAYLVEAAIEAAELGQPLTLPGDGRTIPAERMLSNE